MTASRWSLAHGRHLDLGAKALVMGVLNVTPDSFSDGGQFHSVDRALAQARLMVDDVWGLQREPGIARLAAKTRAGLVIMHTGREREKLPDVIADQFAFLEKSLDIAAASGVRREQIVLDPGFGFAKDAEENLRLLARFGELSAFGLPLMAGTSRKRFIGHVTGRDTDARDAGTAATSVILRLKGAALFRVHDVAINVDALAFADAMLAREKAAGS
jgi:dihydropteroate synthase